jgi:hypothetical protein
MTALAAATGAAVASAQEPAAAPARAVRKAPVECPSCRRWEAFTAAREARDWATADGLVTAMVEDGKRGEVAGYLVYDRDRCTEALEVLRPIRDNFPVKYTSTETSVTLSALVCEAARLEATEPAKSKTLLAEAIDKDITVQGPFTFHPDLYHEFAWQAVLNETAMRFLARHQLDNEESGYAIQSQIGAGRVGNVRRLLALGANPNEFHGRQHAALGAVLQLLPKQPDVALEIAQVLLDAGADPAMLVDFEAEGRPDDVVVEPTPARKRFNELLKSANARLAKTMPVRIDLYDTGPAPAGSKVPGYARFYVFNRSGRDLVLDNWRDANGFDVAGTKVSLEVRLAPGHAWKRYGVAEDEDASPPAGRRVLFPDGDRVLLYVPFDPYFLFEGVPGLQLRVRIPSMDGEDYLSTSFTLHDGRSVRGAWPRDPTDNTVYVERGSKFMVPGGVPKEHEDHEIAPHSHIKSE